MIIIPTKSSGSLSSDNILSINHTRIQGALTRQDLTSVNRGSAGQTPCTLHGYEAGQMTGGGRTDNPGDTAGSRQRSDSRWQSGSRPAPGSQTTHSSGSRVSPGVTSDPRQSARQASAGQAAQPAMTRTTVSNTVSANPLPRRMPDLRNLIQKGQKSNIGTAGQLKRLNVAMGWDTTDSRCDIDLSAYLLNRSGRVPGDDWFVFYGQTISPDGSVSLNVNGSAQDREIAAIDLTRLKPDIRKIVFVLTINEAFTYHLNFSMVKDAYIRLLDPDSGREILSFLLTDYYANVTSMMLGEIYLHNDTWKFNAIGNGVARDLAGLCELYGVQTN